MNMNKSIVTVLLLAGTAMSLFAEKPNIIVLMTDDLAYWGYSSTGNTDIKTPHVDKLIGQGVFCTEAYATHAVCAPSRAGFVTGRYQSRFGYETLTRGKPGYGVDTREIFISDLMRKAGYRTGMFGKWHLGIEDEFQPLARGFDYTFNFKNSCNYFKWKNVFENGVHVDGEGYTIEAMTDKAIAFMERNKEKPFFMYYASPLVHGGFECDPKYLQPGETVTTAKANEEDRANHRIVYNAMINAFDAQIGRLMAKLEELGLAKNTIIVLTNDNGGVEFVGNRPYSGGKGSYYEGGVRMPFAVSWPGVIKPGTTYSKSIVSNLDLLPTLVKAAGGTLPDDREYDGENIMPYLTGKAEPDPDRAHFWRNGGGYAVRQGKWKMMWKIDPAVRKAAQDASEGFEGPKISNCEEVLLFNLETDVAEKNNVADQYPEVVEQMKKEITEFSKLRENDPIYK